MRIGSGVTGSWLEQTVASGHLQVTQGWSPRSYGRNWDRLSQVHSWVARTCGVERGRPLSSKPEEEDEVQQLGRTTLEEYGPKFEKYCSLTRRDGILELRLQSDGGPFMWGPEQVAMLPELFH